MNTFSIKHIEWAYRLILGREPENRHVLESHFANLTNIEELSYSFITSIEGILRWQKDRFVNTRAVFLHIPKTSGSSFLNLLSNNYNEDFSNYYSSCDAGGNLGGKVLSSHCRYEYFTRLNRALLFFSIVRDPLETAISLFNFVPIVNEIADENGLKRNNIFLYSPSMRITLLNGPLAGEALDNPQCRYFGASTFEKVLEIWDKENFLVGCFDHQQEFADTCADLLHWSCRDFPHVNANPERNYLQRYLEEPGLVELLTSRNQEDIKLYEYVKSKIVVNTIKSDFDLTPLYPSSAAE